MSYGARKDFLREKILAMHFMGIVKQHLGGSQAIEDIEYRNKICMVSEKIDQWHEKMQRKKETNFVFDDEFIEDEHSPNRFNESDESSCSSTNRSELIFDDNGS